MGLLVLSWQAKKKKKKILIGTLILNDGIGIRAFYEPFDFGWLRGMFQGWSGPQISETKNVFIENFSAICRTLYLGCLYSGPSLRNRSVTLYDVVPLVIVKLYCYFVIIELCFVMVHFNCSDFVPQVSTWRRPTGTYIEMCVVHQDQINIPNTLIALMGTLYLLSWAFISFKFGFIKICSLIFVPMRNLV